MRLSKRLVSTLLSVSLVASMLVGNGQAVGAAESKTTEKTEAVTKTASQSYVEAMSPGWNLGNTMESCDTGRVGMDLADTDRETLWGQPKVVKEVFTNVKAKGYNSVRIPVTYEGSVGDSKTGYKIDEKWMTRIKEVVDMALDADLYVEMDMHNESWMWLNTWDGNEASEQYVKYAALWTQVAYNFKDYSNKLSFETINEPQFTESDAAKQEQYLEKLNLCAYNIIRKSGGNNATRMIVIPTLNTNHNNCEPIYNQISTQFKVDGKQDPNVIATVHYYGEWVFSANLGRTNFDENLWNDNPERDGDTQRTSIDSAFEKVYNNFTKNGIGVIIGEYGLLGYDSGEECLQQGEELKYYEYVNYVARNYGITLMLWDNGSMLNRTKSCTEWKNPTVGAWLEALQKGRASYTVGLDTIYLKQENGAYTFNNISIPLRLNGNELKGIKDQNKTLELGKEYTYNPATATVTLNKDYVKSVVEAAGNDIFDTVATLKFEFNKGASWTEYIRTCKDTEYTAANAGDTNAPVKLAINYNGNKIRRMTAYNKDGNKVGPQSSWWGYLQNTDTYVPDYQNNTLNLKANFFNDGSVPKEGEISLRIEMYNGDVVTYTFNRSADGVTMIKPEVPEESPAPSETPAVSESPAPSKTPAPSAPVKATVKFTKSVNQMNKGKTATFKAAVVGATGSVSYTSSNSKVISINKKTGVAKANKVGTAKITATYVNGNVKASKTVTVKVKSPATSIKINTPSNKNTIYLKKGSSYTIDKTVKPSDTTDKVTFKSSNKKIATVSSKGKIVAKKTGTVKITVTAGKKKATLTVKVVAKNTVTKKVTVNKKAISLKKGKSYSIVPTVTPVYTTDRLTYSTNKKSVATVNKNGVVTAKKKGTAYITVKSGKKTVKVKVTVK
ncbi:MAG: cellulase family glycosylhydrolase [bacterium]|nr:cellulase family glycosylhydrolase [bacterium]